MLDNKDLSVITDIDNTKDVIGTLHRSIETLFIGALYRVLNENNGNFYFDSTNAPTGVDFHLRGHCKATSIRMRNFPESMVLQRKEDLIVAFENDWTEGSHENTMQYFKFDDAWDVLYCIKQIYEAKREDWQ